MSKLVVRAGRIRKRYFGLAKKLMKMNFSSFTEETRRKEGVDSRIFVNSIPKAGTNLLESTLNEIPGLSRASYRTLVGYHDFNKNALKKIASLRPGYYSLAHLPAHPEVIELLSREGIKIINMIRDPRDIVVSHYKYVTNIDITHPAHKYYSSLSDDDERLEVTICGVNGIVRPIGEFLRKFSGWLDLNRSIIVRYEDLVGRRGGGSDIEQETVVSRLLEFLDIDFDEGLVGHICQHGYSNKSMTFRGSMVGDWRKVFSPYHVRLFKEQAGELLVQYGYERDLDW